MRVFLETKSYDFTTFELYSLHLDVIRRRGKSASFSLTNDFTIFTFISEHALLSKKANPINETLKHHKCLEEFSVAASPPTLFLMQLSSSFELQFIFIDGYKKLTIVHKEKYSNI